MAQKLSQSEVLKLPNKVPPLDEGTTSQKKGAIELAYHFTIVYPASKYLSIKLLIITVIAISCILGSIIGLKLYKRHSIVGISHVSGELLSDNVVLEMPAFSPSGELVFIRKESERQASSANSIFSMEIHTKRKKKLLSLNHEILDVSISPNGQLLAFTTLRSDTSQIAVTFMKESLQRVVTSGKFPSSCPFFLRDSEQIVFQSRRGKKDELFLINSDGSNQRSLGWEGRRPFYSPTRDEIVFESDMLTGVSNIWRVTIGKKDLINLTKATKIEDACFSPSFSPDGEWILFHKKRKGLWVMKRDGTKQGQILAGNFATMIGRISPDGRNLAVCAGNGHSKGNLYLYTLYSPAFGRQARQTGKILSRFPVKTRDVPVKLRIVPELYINATPWADVILNSEPKGKTPLTLYNVPINAVIVLKHELYEKTFKVEQLKENRLSYDFPSQSR